VDGKRKQASASNGIQLVERPVSTIINTCSLVPAGTGLTPGK